MTLLHSVVCGCRFLVTRRLSRRWQRCTSQAGPHHRLMQPPMRGPQPEDPELSAVDCGYILQEPHGRTAHGRRAWAHGAWAGIDSGALASGAITDRLIGGRNMTRRGPPNLLLHLLPRPRLLLLGHLPLTPHLQKPSLTASGTTRSHRRTSARWTSLAKTGGSRSCQWRKSSSFVSRLSSASSNC